MPDEPTLGEIVRRMEAGFSDIKDDFRELGRRLDTKVSMERYDIEQRARDEAHKLLLERVKGIEDARLEQERKRQADRRLILTALVVPVLLVLLQVYLSTRGAGS
jgi:predicted nucleic acid-binding Zn ribbon protein